VRRLMDRRGQGQEVAGLEAELSSLAYGVYSLAPNEIAPIEEPLA
jgi:hypothetical protein